MADRLAEATGGQHHWNDPGMDDFETGWEELRPGLRVEVRTQASDKQPSDQWVWRRGTIRETPHENDRAIVVECDEPWHAKMDFYEGRGATVPVMMNTRRGIWSVIRTLSRSEMTGEATTQ